jgi:hypothetical protein
MGGRSCEQVSLVRPSLECAGKSAVPRNKKGVVRDMLLRDQLKPTAEDHFPNRNRQGTVRDWERGRWKLKRIDPDPD